MGSVGILRHEAALRDARTEEEGSQAWQRACAFIQSELRSFSVAEATLRDSHLSLLHSCRACAKQSHQSTWLQHFATLQYQVIRTLHERGDNELVVSEGSALLNFLAEMSAAGMDVTTVQANCLVAVISSCARASHRLQLTSLQLLCNHTASVAEQDPSQGEQLARNLVLSQVNAANEKHGPLNRPHAHEMLLIIDTCISPSTNICWKLVVQLARAVPAATIASLLQSGEPSPYHRSHVQALLSEYVRRFADEFPSQHGDPLPSIAMMEILASQIQENPSPAATLASLLHSCAALVKYIALRLKPQSSNTWAGAMSRALEVLCLCCQRADMLMSEVQDPTRKPGQPLPQALRRLSASTFNASIDVRKEQPRFALGLLLASASCCVVMATRCDLDGGNDALRQLVHDSIKRCMLGFNTAAEVRDKEHFLVTGLQILCTVCTYAEDDACRGSIVQAATQLLMAARTLFKNLQTHIHSVSLHSSCNTHQIVDWHRTMIRTAGNICMVVHRISDMCGADNCTPDVMLQAIPLLLDCRAIASLSLCTTAVSLISESLLLVASCTHRSDTTDAAAPALPTTRTLTGQANEQQAHHAHSLHNLACMQLLPPRLMNESVMPVPSGALSMLQSTVGGPGAAEREVFAGISEKPRRGGAHQRGAARPSDNRGISATCVAIVLEASAAIERLSVQHNKKQPASTVDESAVTGALGAALKLVHMAGSVSTSGSSVHHRSLAVELYVCAAEVMEHVAVVLGSRAGEIPEMELSMKEVPTILKGSALSCSQRLLLASCEMLERACNICEGCLLEGSESTAEVQFNTQNGDRGQQNGSSKDAMLSVRGIGCWHLAVQMIQAASQCGRLSDSLGLSHRAMRWQNLLRKLLASLDLPLASACFLRVSSKYQPQTSDQSADPGSLSGEAAEGSKPHVSAEQEKLCDRSAAPLDAESVAALTASAALLASESSLPLLGAGLAAQSLEIVDRHGLKSAPQLGGQRTEDAAQSEGMQSSPLLEWGAELLIRCPVPCTDGPTRSASNRVKSGTGKENSAHSRTGQCKVADRAAVGKTGAPVNKTRKGSTISDTKAPHAFPFPSFKMLTDMETHSPEDVNYSSQEMNKADSKDACILLMQQNLSAAHKRVAASMHLNALQQFAVSTDWSGESMSVNIMEHESSNFIFGWLEDVSAVRFSTPPVLPCISGTKDVKSSGGDHLSSGTQAPKRQTRSKRAAASAKSTTARSKVNKEANPSPVSAVHGWILQLMDACMSSASPATTLKVAGRYLSSLAAVCCRHCLSSLCDSSSDTGNSLNRAWFSPSLASTEKVANAKVEVQVTVLMLCAAIAVTGLRAPTSAPLLQQLSCVTSVAGLCAFPLACTYAANTLVSMHAALLSAPNQEENFSASQGEAQQDGGVSHRLLAILGKGGSAGAAEGEALALSTLQVLSEAVHWKDFGLEGVEKSIHVAVQQAWGSSQETLCMCHMQASQGLPPFLLASSWLSTGHTQPNTITGASASVNAAGDGDGGQAVARAAALLLRRDAADSQLEQLEAEESDSSKASTDSSAARSEVQQNAPSANPTLGTSGDQASQEATADAFQTVLDTIERILAESSSGCKRWTAAWTARSKAIQPDDATAVQGNAEPESKPADLEIEEDAESCAPADVPRSQRSSARKAPSRGTKASKSKVTPSTARSDKGREDAGSSSMSGSASSKRGNLEDGSSSSGPAAVAPTQESSEEGTKRQWWEWRVRLDAELAGATADLNRICGAALQHCMHTQTDATAEAGDSTSATHVQHGDGSDADATMGAAGPPLRLSLDWDMHRIPWETLPALSQHSVFRSFPSPCTVHKGQRCRPGSNLGRGYIDGDGVVDIDAAVASYIVDPSGDLPGTRQRFEQWFQEVPGWVGNCGTPALECTDLRQSMEQHDLFVYLGHGAGVHLHDSACLPTQAPAAVLMGCSSGRLRPACGAPGNALVGPVSTYATHGSPCVVVNLWDVTDRDIDRFTHQLLSSVVPGAPATSKTSKNKYASAPAASVLATPKAALRNATVPGTSTQANASAAADALAAMKIPTEPGQNVDVAATARARGRQPAVQLPVPSTPHTVRKGRLQRMHGSAAPATSCLSQTPSTPATTRHRYPPGPACEDAGMHTPTQVTANEPGTVAPMSVATPATGRRRGRLQRMAASSRPATEMPVQLRRTAICVPAVEEESETEDCNTVVEPPSLRKLGPVTGVDSQSNTRASDVRLIAACVAHSRNACLLRFLNGAAPVCYGVPTRWQYTCHKGLNSDQLQA